MKYGWRKSGTMALRLFSQMRFPLVWKILMQLCHPNDTFWQCTQLRRESLLKINFVGCTLHLLPFIGSGSLKVTKYMAPSFNVSSILWLMNPLLDLYRSSGRLLHCSLGAMSVSISLVPRISGQNLPILISFDSLSDVF